MNVQNEPQQIGNYRIISLLGSGGMGAVYLAERSDDLDIRVAIKVLTRSGDSFASQRFIRERHLLARLKHPNIAQIIDGGITEDQQQWFAMELVEGETLNTYLENNKLSLIEKLKLFCKICSAVSYAHQNFIIHRDLKPSNIMVDTNGEPRLLDFGVAGLVDPTAEDQTLTMVGRAFTPQYASPEQMRGEPLGAASDVYALGIIFYEMISGAQPYLLMGQSPQAIIGLICEKPVTRPSDALSTGSQAEVKLLRNKLRGDLDTIAMKALAKTPAERYSSVEQFSQDVANYMADLPIQARTPTLGYRSLKMLQRYRAAVALIATTFLLLTGALFYSLQQQRIAEEPRRAAEAESQRANQQAALAKEQQEIAEKGYGIMNGFFRELGPNSNESSLNDIHEALSRVERSIRREFKENQRAKLRFLDRISRSFSASGFTQESNRIADEILRTPDVTQHFSMNEIIYIATHCDTKACLENAIPTINKIKPEDFPLLSQTSIDSISYLHFLSKEVKSPLKLDETMIALRNYLIENGSNVRKIAYNYSLGFESHQPYIDLSYSEILEELIRQKDRCFMLSRLSKYSLSFLVNQNRFEDVICLHFETKEILDKCVDENSYYAFRKNVSLSNEFFLFSLSIKNRQSFFTDKASFYTTKEKIDKYGPGPYSIDLTIYFLFQQKRADDLGFFLENISEGENITQEHFYLSEVSIIYGWSLYYFLTGQYNRNQDLLEHMIRSGILDSNQNIYFKAELARNYIALEKFQTAALILDEVHAFLNSLSEPVRERGWDVVEITEQLSAEIREHQSASL
jgi:serine/threonine protein kinase